MSLAPRLPKLWMAASSPNAEPRSSSGVASATAPCSAVSTNPMVNLASGEPDRQGGEAGSGQTEDQVGTHLESVATSIVNGWSEAGASGVLDAWRNAPNQPLRSPEPLRSPTRDQIASYARPEKLRVRFRAL